MSQAYSVISREEREAVVTYELEPRSEPETQTVYASLGTTVSNDVYNVPAIKVSAVSE